MAIATQKKHIAPFIVFIAVVNLYIGLKLTVTQSHSGIYGHDPHRSATDDLQSGFGSLGGGNLAMPNAPVSAGNFTSVIINVNSTFNKDKLILQSPQDSSQNNTGKTGLHLINRTISSSPLESWQSYYPVKQEYLDLLPADVINHPRPNFVEGLESPCFVIEGGSKHNHIVKPTETKTKKIQHKIPQKKTKRQKYLIGDQPNYEGLPSLHANHLHCLPPFYFVGFTKSGTTEFYGHFVQHQHVIAPVFKEPRFWDENRSISLQRRSLQYMTRNHETMAAIIESCFLGNDSHICHGIFQSNQWDLDIRLNLDDLYKDLQKYKSQGQSCPLVSVDASTTYVSNSFMWESDPANNGYDHPNVLAPHRIRYLQPNAKIVILLRDPKTRLYSDFNFFIRSRNNGPNLFHKLVVGGIAWWKECTQTYSDQKCAYTYNLPNISALPKGTFAWGDKAADKYNAAGRLRQGLYSIFISKWYEVFPKEQILIIKFEEYSSNSIEIMKSKVYPFLNMAPLDASGEKRLADLKNKGHLNKRKQGSNAMLVETEQLLNAFYRPYNEKLAALLSDSKFLW